MATIYLISGKQGSGKSSLAAALANKIHTDTGEYVAVIKFADPIYTMHEYIMNFMEKTTGVPRVDKDGTLLQYLGTEFGRTRFGPNVWVDAAVKAVSRETRPHIIIDDARFENEFDAFPDALSIRLFCDRDIRKARTHSWRENDTHPSEVGLDAYESRGKFLLEFDTAKVSIDDIVNYIFGTTEGLGI